MLTRVSATFRMSTCAEMVGRALFLDTRNLSLKALICNLPLHIDVVLTDSSLISYWITHIALRRNRS